MAKSAADSLVRAPRFQPQAVLAGVVLTLLLSIVISGGVASAVYFTDLSESFATNLLFYAGVGALAIGAAYGARQAQGAGWVHGVAVGVVWVTLTVLLTLVFFPGTFLVGELIHRFVLGIAAGFVGGILGVNA